MKITIPEIPFPCAFIGAGYSCPILKLHGYGTERQLVNAAARLLSLPREAIARKGIFLPAEFWVKQEAARKKGGTLADFMAALSVNIP